MVRFVECSYFDQFEHIQSMWHSDSESDEHTVVHGLGSDDICYGWVEHQVGSEHAEGSEQSGWDGEFVYTNSVGVLLLRVL